METFWKEALKVGGIVTIVMFVILSIFRDIVAKFSPIPPEYTLILAGLIITMLFLSASKAMDKDKKDDNDDKKDDNDDKKSGDNGVSIGDNNSGTVVVGNGNITNIH